MGLGRRGIGLKSTPQSSSPLLSRNSENGFLLWGKNTLFQFPLVFLPWDSRFPSILTSWDLDKCVEKIIHSNHIHTNRSCRQRCLERAERKWPSRTVFWPLAVWVAWAAVRCIPWLWHLVKTMNLMKFKPTPFIMAGGEIHGFSPQANVPFCDTGHSLIVHQAWAEPGKSPWTVHLPIGEQRFTDSSCESEMKSLITSSFTSRGWPPHPVAEILQG